MEIPILHRSKGWARAIALGGQVLICRLPADELHTFVALCTQLGAKSRSDGVRSVVRMASGFLEFSRKDSSRLEEIRYEMGKIGTNVNQIALAANRGRAPMVKAQWAKPLCGEGASGLHSAINSASCFA